MTDYEKSLIFNCIAITVLFVGVIALLAAGVILLPWWPARVACVIGLIWYAFRTIAAYYATR